MGDQYIMYKFMCKFMCKLENRFLILFKEIITYINIQKHKTIYTKQFIKNK
jgi:hypothetical protein